MRGIFIFRLLNITDSLCYFGWIVSSLLHFPPSPHQMIRIISIMPLRRMKMQIFLKNRFDWFNFDYLRMPQAITQILNHMKRKIYKLFVWVLKNLCARSISKSNMCNMQWKENHNRIYGFLLCVWGILIDRSESSPSLLIAFAMDFRSKDPMRVCISLLWCVRSHGAQLPQWVTVN